jgi:hypothetical protein
MLYFAWVEVPRLFLMEVGMASAALAATEIRDGLWRRYKDAYAVAAAVIRFGKLVQKVAVIAGALILFMFLAGSFNSSFLIIPGILGAAMVGLGGWISGMLLMAQGQIIQSVIDTAVNTSTLLDNPAKAQFLSIRSDDLPSGNPPICTKCGTAAGFNAKFCNKCGQSLNGR